MEEFLGEIPITKMPIILELIFSKNGPPISRIAMLEDVVGRVAIARQEHWRILVYLIQEVQCGKEWETARVDQTGAVVDVESCHGIKPINRNAAIQKEVQFKAVPFTAKLDGVLSLHSANKIKPHPTIVAKILTIQTA